MIPELLSLFELTIKSEHTCFKCWDFIPETLLSMYLLTVGIKTMKQVSLYWHYVFCLTYHSSLFAPSYYMDCYPILDANPQKCSAA